MLMDYELNVHVNEIIANLVKEAKEEYYTNLDMVVTQNDKYENTQYDNVTIGLGHSKGLPTNLYYFNAVEDDNNEDIEKYYNEPVSYYEHCGKGCMMYRIQVDTMSRIIRIFEVRYGRNDKDVIYHTLNELELGDSKFRKKVQVVS